MKVKSIYFDIQEKKKEEAFVFLGIQVTNGCFQKFLVDRKLMGCEASRNSPTKTKYHLLTLTPFQACMTLFLVCVTIKKNFCNRITLLVEFFVHNMEVYAKQNFGVYKG